VKPFFPLLSRLATHDFDYLWRLKEKGAGGKFALSILLIAVLQRIVETDLKGLNGPFRGKPFCINTFLFHGLNMQI
jgi:hypothetical protein